MAGARKTWRKPSVVLVCLLYRAQKHNHSIISTTESQFSKTAKTAMFKADSDNEPAWFAVVLSLHPCKTKPCVMHDQRSYWSDGFFFLGWDLAFSASSRIRSESSSYSNRLMSLHKIQLHTTQPRQPRLLLSLRPLKMQFPSYPSRYSSILPGSRRGSLPRGITGLVMGCCTRSAQWGPRMLRW